MSGIRDAYTLVVPTFNRSGLLASLLRFMEREAADFRVVLVDSSGAEHRGRNRELAKRVLLDVEYVECEETTRPFDKFGVGVGRVETPFCGLCADDDLIIVAGVERCVEELQRHPDVCVAHGYYFTFLDDGTGPGAMDLFGIPYYAPDIDSTDPVLRLRQLFRNYQALTYGTYRTQALQRVLELVNPVESLLARELLGSALSVMHGKVRRLRCFTNGRSFGPSGNYRHWHPLEWLIDWPDGLFAEYGRYREILIRELMATPAYGRSLETTQRIVDLIHMFYLLRHVPLEAYDFILDHVSSGKEPYEFWSADQIQLPLIRASAYFPPPTAGGAKAEPSEKPMMELVGRLRGLFAKIGRRASSEVFPRRVRTSAREYRLHQQFVRPEPVELFSISDVDVARLLQSMDGYIPERGDEQAALGPMRGSDLASAASGGDLALALEGAARAGHLHVVRDLVEECNADVSAAEDAALMAAAAGGHLETVRYLHSRGADPNARGGEALPAAAAGGHAAVVRYLHENGAEHSLLSPEGRERISDMQREIEAASAIYRPSRIWEFLGAINSKMLAWGGEANFKRTVNQNYFNFIPTSLRDPKIVNLARLWLSHRSLKPLRYRIEDPDRDPGRWCSWDESYYVFKENHDFRLRLYKWFVAGLYEYALKTDSSGVLPQLQEPELGNPIRVWRDGKLVSQDLVNSVRERNTIVEALGGAARSRPARIAELGAGYGRLGHVLLSTYSCRYFVFDIPPALYIAEWYLTRLFPAARVFRFRTFGSWKEIASELEEAEIGFFTANQLEYFPARYFDAFVTISSLQEMRPEQIAHFLDLMAARADEMIYLKQHEDYLNPYDGLRIRRSDYRLHSDWGGAVQRRDLANPGFFELVARRRR